MPPEPVYTTSCIIRCPTCAKAMLLKHWKHHCRQMHTMSETAIDRKYIEFQQNVGHPKSKIQTLCTPQPVEKPCPLTTNSLFSMKKIVVAKPTRLEVNVVDFSSQMNQSQPMELDSQMTSPNSIINSIEPAPLLSNVDIDIHENDNSVQPRTSPSFLAATPSDHNILLHIDQINAGGKDGTSNDLYHAQHNDDHSRCETSRIDDKNEGNEPDDKILLSPTSTKTVEEMFSYRPAVMKKHIEGVKFITSSELKFVDEQRKKYPSISWFTEDKHKLSEPRPNWFANMDRKWLRAICTENRYGLLCVDCAEYATDATLIERNNGAFILRPYWKLKQKGLFGIKRHQNSDLHRQSRKRQVAAKIVEVNGNTTAQINCVNLEAHTEKYLRVLLQTLWFIIEEEMPLMKFKTFVELLHKVECPSIVQWLNLSNVKQRYWGHEATFEWLISINKYINHHQIASLKQTDFINLIIDETTDISVKKIICICLRYVEKESGVIKEEVFKLGRIHDASGEGIFYVVEEFINTLEEQVGKEFIITAQTYDGGAAMRFEAKGHIQSRMSAWAINIYCRPHLLNLSIKDAIDHSFYDAFDTIKSALIYLGDNSHRLEILHKSQKVTGSSKKGRDFHFEDVGRCHISNLIGHGVPKLSIKWWSYSSEVLRFACQHYSAIILSFATISQSKNTGSSDARRYLTDLIKPIIVFQIHFLRGVLRPAMKFLKEIEKGGLCLDQFSCNVNAAKQTISQAMNKFNLSSFRATLNKIKTYAPVSKLTSNSTQLQESTSIDLNEDELRSIGNDFVQHVLKSLDERFNFQAQEIIQNLYILSSPSNQSPKQIINNPLIQKYTSLTTYKHKGADGKIYERTGKPLLNMQNLKDDLYAFCKIVENLTSIPSILLKLAKSGSEQCLEWYRLYQILATFAVGSNESERMFSTLRRIKSWSRNQFSDSTIEALVKVSILDIQLTDEAINYIIQDFVKNPGRAKSRNVKLFLETDQEKQKDEESF